MGSEQKVRDWGQNTKEPLNVVFIEGKSGLRNPGYFPSDILWEHKTNGTPLHYPINLEAHGRTGWNTRTRIGSVGVGITHCRNGIVEIECDLWRLGVDLIPEFVAPLAAKWEEQAQKLPRAIRNRRCIRFDSIVINFPTLPEFLDDWRNQLRELLSNPKHFDMQVKTGVGKN